MSVLKGTNKGISIGGRSYSGHAVDEMQSSGITPSVVEDAITNNKGVPGNKPGSMVHDSSTNGVRAVVNEQGRVITVSPIPRAKPHDKP
jgi:hypothetical protein